MTDRTGAGELRWNIKQSFRDYVLGLPDGSESWRADRGGIDDGDLVFDYTGTDEQAGGLRFAGAVRWRGYRGALHVDLADPWIVPVGDGTSVVTVNVAPPGTAARREPIVLVTGQPSRDPAGRIAWSSDHVELTAGGAAILGSVYPPGTAAEQLLVRVSPDNDQETAPSHR